MAVIFSELFAKECEKHFGINRKQVQESYTEPDEYQKLIAQGLELWFYLKKFPRYYLLVHGYVQNGHLLIHLAFKVRPELVDLNKRKKPLEITEMLALHYGLKITIGSQTAKFIYNEIIPRDERLPLTNMVQIHNPDKHSFVQSMFFKIIQNGNTHAIQCAIAFCIDKDNYLSWIDGL